MHKLNFIEAAAIDAVQLEGANLESPVCRECAVSFRENMRVVLGLASVPGWSALGTMQWSEAGTNAAQKVLNSTAENAVLGAEDEKRLKLIRETHVQMAAIVDRDMPDLSRKLEFSTKMLEEIAMKSGPYVHGMFHTLLKVICVQSWGAIEVLCEDLLTGAVDQHAADFTHIEKDKLYFRKLDDGIRKWYRRAFRSGVSDGSLSALAQIRHVLVHSGGLVDDFFKKAVTEIEALKAFASYKEGDILLFDGDGVRTLVDPAIKQGYKLIVAVDRWLLSKHLSRMHCV